MERTLLSLSNKPMDKVQTSNINHFPSQSETKKGLCIIKKNNAIVMCSYDKNCAIVSLNFEVFPCN